MQELPGDVLLVILHMLAVQDPYALVAVNCLCRRFRRPVAENPGLWKEAFYGASTGRGEVPLEDHCAEQRAKLETDVHFLGGHKRLVEARCWTRRDCEQRQNGDGPRVGPPKGCDFANSNSSRQTRLLTVIRLNGSILFWSVYEAPLALYEVFPEGEKFEYETWPWVVTAPNLTTKYQEKVIDLSRLGDESDSEELTFETYALACSALKAWDRSSMTTQFLHVAIFGLYLTVQTKNGPFYPVFHRQKSVGAIGPFMSRFDHLGI